MSNKKLTGTLIPKDNKKAKMHATFYSDKPIGSGGDSEIFDEYIDATDQQRNTALANVSNQTANSTTGKMGYKVLDPTKTFASQVTTENTIYEIRDVFDLGGETFTMPDDCVLKFNGGMIDSGALIATNTNIEAGSIKIFGDNLILYNACFKKKSGNYGEIITTLPWVDVVNRTVRLVSTGYYWKLTCSGYRRCSNKDGLGVFSSINGDGNDVISFDNDLVLDKNPGSFYEVTNTTTSVVMNTLNGLKLCVINGKNGSVFTIPNYSNYAFFSSNGANDNPNETYIQPGTEVDLSQGNIYVSYLNRCEIDSRNSSFVCDGKLSWFVGDNYSHSYANLNVLDQSKQVQSAFDSSMNITSDIRGIVVCNSSLYLETPKKIDLGAHYQVTSSPEFVDNSKKVNTFSFNSTVFVTKSTVDMIVQRVTVEFVGGLLTTKFSDNHHANIWVVDLAYESSESIIRTSMFGKSASGLHTNAGIYIESGDCGGFASFSTIDCSVAYCKYGIYAIGDGRGGSYYNSSYVKLFVNRYYEGVHISGLFGASQLNITLQAGPVVPIAEVDNYRHAYIASERCAVSITTWDLSLAKNSNVFQQPYKKIIVKGTGTVLVGNSINKNAQSYIELSKNYGFTGRDPKLLFLDYQTNLFLPKLNDCFYGLGTNVIHNTNSYMKVFRVKEGESVDISTLNSKSINNSSVEEVKNWGSIFEWCGMFSSGMSKKNNLEQGDYVELYIESKSGYSLIKSYIYNLGFYNELDDENLFDNIKFVITNSSGSKVINRSYSNTGLVETNSYDSISSLLVRWYYNTANYGAPKAFSNIKPIFRLYAFARDSRFSNNWSDQRIRSYTTTSLPTSNIIIGETFYDTTLSKPLWGKNATSYVDCDGFNPMRKSGTTAQRNALTGISEGYQYYDTDLKKWVYHNGTTWLNFDGSALS